jgi:F-type H+-transporting ATPase subunit delta
MSGSIARRYAKAIVAVAQEQNALEQTGDELRLLRALAADSQIARGLANPLLAATARRGLARAIAEQLTLRPIMRNFLCLLADHRRLDQLGEIADQYQKILDQQLGRVRATITSAAPLDPEQADAVIAALARQTGHTVLAEQRVNPQLLGGVVVDVEGTVYDGSLRAQLEGLAASIAGGRSLL